MRGAVRDATWRRIWSGKWWTLTTAVSTPAAASASRPRSSKVFPATGTSGFGIVLVIGRSRVPSPAASTMAVLGALPRLTASVPR